MKKTNFNKFTFVKNIISLTSTALIAGIFSLPTIAQQTSEPSALGPLRIQDGKLLDSYGKPFIFRGVTIDHTLAPDKTVQALKDIAAAGANSAQIEFTLRPDNFPRTVAAQLREIIAACKANKLVCVLEANDSAGYSNYSGYSLNDLVAFWLWSDMTSVLAGNQSHIVIGLGNQHFAAEAYPGEYRDQVMAYVSYLLNNLPGGYLVMLDGDNWAEDTGKSMQNLARQSKDPTHILANRLIYSVDMFYSYQDPTRVRDYIASFNEIGAPLVIGGFAQTPYYHPNRPTPLNQDAPQIPVASVMQYAEQYGAGYFGWSWSGNKNSFLDIVTNYDPSALTSWGNLLFNDVNGIKATAKRASIYDNISSSSSSSSSSTQANRPPVVDFFVSNYPSIFCGSPNAGQGKITATATGTYDPDGDPLTYLWSGPGATATGETATFKSWSGYSYQVTLTVTDSHGASASAVRSVAPFYLDCPFSSASSTSLSSSSSVRSSLISSSSRSSSSSKPSSSSRSSFSSMSSFSSASSRSSSPQTSSSNSSMPFIQGKCTYHIQSEWRDGFTATIRLKNMSSLPMNGWDVKWQYPDSSKVTSLWNATLSGTNPYSAKNLGWNAIIQPGQTVEFGFQGKKPAGQAVTPAFIGTVCLPTIVQ